jgi:clan AA aspartic protease (TIGR02281 family)
MRIGSLSIAFGLALWLGASSVQGEIYRWTDAEGSLHFTQRLDQVPPEHRAAARSKAKAPTSAVIQTYEAPASATRSAVRRTRRRPGESLRIPFERDGTLMRVNVKLDGLVTAPFYIDTGASGVSLPSSVAERLGFRVRPDTPHTEVITASGTVSRAIMTLQSVELAGARVENLHATVNPAMEIGLLGGTFFNNFVYRVDAAAGYIDLKPNENIRGGMGAIDWKRRFRAIQRPLARLENHLETADIDDEQERAYLENRAVTLRAQLDALALEANRLDVPYAWRH